MTKILNFYGGPGTGKSTTAALAYAKLKQAGVNCELVREYVKEWAWEKRPISTYDQIYVLGKQIRRESMLYGKTDVIVTDSPAMLGIYYSGRYCPPLVCDAVRAATLAFYKQAELDGHEHIHVFLTRTKPYKSEGRYQTEEQAREIDGHLELLLKELGFGYMTASTNEHEMSDLLLRLGLI
jgi:nicotinamide riboside kinase